MIILAGCDWEGLKVEDVETFKSCKPLNFFSFIYKILSLPLQFIAHLKISPECNKHISARCIYTTCKSAVLYIKDIIYPCLDG